MKGATTEPEVSTIKPLRTIRTATIGRSQNFFRSRMKAQSSTRKSPIPVHLLSQQNYLILTLHVSRRTFSSHPSVCFTIRLKVQLQEILTHDAQQSARRHHDTIVNEKQYDSGIHPCKYFRQSHPPPV